MSSAGQVRSAVAEAERRSGAIPRQWNAAAISAGIANLVELEFFSLAEVRGSGSGEKQHGGRGPCLLRRIKWYPTRRLTSPYVAGSRCVDGDRRLGATFDDVTKIGTEQNDRP